MKKQLCIFICISVIALGHSNEVCDYYWPTCGKNIENIVCERGETCEPETDCQELPPDPEFLKFIVQEHNRLRNDIASEKETRGFTGPAANMMTISYDKDLEYSARCNVNTCKFQHDRCRGTKKFRFAGQNMYYTTDSKEGLKQAVVKWYDEINNNTADVIDKFPKGRFDIGHFTQVIWAKTIKVGCATAKSNSEEGEKFFITCNYGPTGNFIGKPVYERGEACSKCPPNVKCNAIYPALCGEIDDSEVDGVRSIFRSIDMTIPPSATMTPGIIGNKTTGASEIANTSLTTEILNGDTGMYDFDTKGVPPNGFIDTFKNGSTKSYGITGLYGIKSVFTDELFDKDSLGLCENGLKVHSSDGMFINGKFITGTLINGHFVPGKFFGDIFYPGISIKDNFIPGVFVDTSFIPGIFIKDVFIPGAFIDNKFVPGTIVNNTFAPGQFDDDKKYNDVIQFNGAWVSGFSGLYGKEIPESRCSGNINKTTLTFVLTICWCLFHFFKAI